MSRKRKFRIKHMTFALLPVMLLTMAFGVLSQTNKANAMDGTEWGKVKTALNNYITGQYSGDAQGEAGFVMDTATLHQYIDPNNDGTYLGEGDDAKDAPVLIDNLMGQTNIIPATSYRCAWNSNCFEAANVATVKGLVDAHFAAGFSTNIVDYCVSGHTEAPTTGAWGYIANASDGAGGFGLSSSGTTKPKVYAFKWGRNGWTSGTIASYANTGTMGAEEAGTSSAATPLTQCAGSTPDSDLVRCAARYAVYTTANGGRYSVPVNGSSNLTTIGAAGQSVDIRTGVLPLTGTISTAGANVRGPLDQLFGSGSLNVSNVLSGSATTVVVGRTPMVSGIAAEGLNMLGYNMIDGTYINGGLPGWKSTEDERQAAQTPYSTIAIAGYTSAAKVDIVAPVINNTTGTAATGRNTANVVRNTSEPATSKIALTGSGGAPAVNVNNTVLNVNKTTALTGLVANTTYTGTLTVYDAQANSASTPISFTTDPPPTVTNILPSGYTKDTTMTISADYSDNGAGIGINASSVMVHLDGSNMLMNCSVQTTSHVECDSSSGNVAPGALSAGTHTVTVYVDDLAGNMGIGHGSFTVDNAAPSTSDNAPGGWQNHDVTVTLTCNDGASGSGCASTSWSGDNGLGSGSGTSVVVSNTGTTVISYHSTDTAGNVETPDKTATVNIDRTAPVLGATTPAGWTNINNPATVSIALTETGSGLNPALTVVQVDGVSPPPCSILSNSISCNISGMAPLGEGHHVITASTTDNAGNPATGSGGGSFDVDTTAPVISNNLPTGTSGNTSPTISASYTDGTGAGINPSTVQVIVNGTPEVIGAGGCTVTATNVSCPKSGLTDNTYLVTVNVSDLLGNVGTRSWSFTVNTAAPVIDSVVPGAGTWTTNLTPTVTISYHATGTIDSATLNIDGTPCSGATWNQTHITCTAPTLTETTHTITGNIGVGANITPASSSFGVDRTGPVLTNKTPSGWIRTASTIEADISETGSGVDGTASSVSLDGTPLAGCSWSNTHVSCPAPALTAGNHWTSYVVYDNVGINNGYGNSLGSFDVDTTAPTFSNVQPSGYTANARPHITGNWSDGTGSGINLGTLDMTIDGTHPASGGCVKDASGFDCALAVDLSEGPHVIGLGVSDNVWNAGSGSGSFTIDTTAPGTTDNAPGGWQNHDVTVTLTCNDGSGSGCASTSWSANNGGGSGSGTSVVVSNTGTTVISYHSTDALGNVETPDKTATVRIEKTNPTVINLLPSGNVSTSLVPLSADLADSDSGINASSANIYVDGSPTALNGCTKTTSAISCEYTASPGSHTFTASVSDVAGNVGTSVTPGSFYVNDFHTTGAIGAKYDSLGGASGFLGTPTTEEYDVAGITGGRAQNFTGGRIYWSAGTGAHEIHGEILTDYLAVGPAILGLPTTDEIDVPGIAGGRKSELQYGTVYWSGVTGAHEVHGAIRGKWLAMGGPATFGLPTSDEADVSSVTGGRWNMFQGGRIYWSAATGAHEMHGAILTKFLALGPAAFGLPTTDETGVPGYGPGRKSELVGATIYWSAATGAYETHGDIRGKWLAMGGPATFGLPTSDEADVSSVTGGRWNMFQGGRIYWSAATGAHEMHGAILTKFLALGPAAFGLPTTDETGVPGYGPGRKSELVGATIYWSAATGAWEVQGGIRGKWLAMGGPSVFGLPTSDEQNVGGIVGGKWSQFQSGNIYWSLGTGPHEVHGAILAKYLEYLGSHASYGLPTSDEFASGSGRRSDFVSGFIYWDAAGGAVVTD